MLNGAKVHAKKVNNPSQEQIIKFQKQAELLQYEMYNI